MKIDMNLLKQLRDITMASLKDCKEALVESEWDLDKAHEILKKSGAAKAAKKADRETNEWVVKFVEKDGKVVGIKLLCETDFVAKNETFQGLVDALLDVIVVHGKNIQNVEEASQELLDGLQNRINESITQIGENVRVADCLSIDADGVYIYNHAWNKVATIVSYQWDQEDMAKDLALQITAMNPVYISIDEVPQEKKDAAVEWEREALLKSGKPEAMVDNIVQGKMLKAMSDSVLLEQEFIRDGSKKVKDVLPEGFVINRFVRYAV